jgi:hypothetical protein
MRIRGATGTTGKAPRRSTQPYLFRGLLTCGLCRRLMVGSVNHGRIYYRCKASRDFVRQHGIDHPPVLYVRQESFIGPIDQFLHEELGRKRLSGTLRRLAGAQHRTIAKAEHDAASQARLRDTIADCDTKIRQYRSALDAGGDPKLSAGWIKETTAARAAAQSMLGTTGPKAERLTEAQIAQIVDGLGGMLALLRDADPLDRAEIYARLGLQMIYRPGDETVTAEIASPGIDGVLDVCRRGDLNPHFQHTRWKQVCMR